MCCMLSTFHVSSQIVANISESSHVFSWWFFRPCWWNALPEYIIPVFRVVFQNFVQPDSVLKIDVPFKNFHMPSQYLYKPCKAYLYCWENNYMPWLKNHLPSGARNHKSLSALGHDLRLLHAPGMRACLNVEPCRLLSFDSVLSLLFLIIFFLVGCYCGFISVQGPNSI